MKDINRRDLLKQFGLAGLMMIPVLRQSRSFAAGFSPIYCQVFKPMGSMTGTYYPNGTDSSFNFTGKTPAALNGLQEYLIVPRGLVQYSQGGNKHEIGIRRNFTNACHDEDQLPIHASIDHLIANHLAIKKTTPLKHIHFSSGTRTIDNALDTTSFPGNQQLKLPEHSVLNMYKMITDPIKKICGDQITPTVSNEDLAKKSILDYHLDNIAATKTALKLSVAEKAKLDTYAEQLRAIEQKIGGLPSTGTAQCPSFPENMEYKGGFAQYSTKRSDVVFDLMVLAMEWELTNVASLMLGSAQDGHKFDEILGSAVNDNYFHPMSHESGEQQSFNRISTFLWSEIASFLNKLKNAKTFEGQSLLDAHCVLISGGEVSYGYTHSYDDMPFIIAGKAGGTFPKTGYTFQVPSSNRLDSHARLLLSVCHAMGLTGLQYVGEQDKCPGGPLIAINNA